MTEHFPELSVQEVALRVPPVCVLDHVTVPVGVLLVPSEVSLTVAVHVVAESTGSGAGVHDSDVDVARFVTPTVSSSALSLWTPLPPYVALILFSAPGALVGV